MVGQILFSRLPLKGEPGFWFRTQLTCPKNSPLKHLPKASHKAPDPVDLFFLLFSGAEVAAKI